MTEMKPEIKARWIERLRSGEDVQGQRLLEYVDDDDVTKRCCLGVLSRMAADEGIVKAEKYAGRIGKHMTKFGEDESGVCVAGLSVDVMKWAGMDSDLGIFTDPFSAHTVNGETNLAGLNDTGYTFDQIADVIEERF